MIVQKMHISPEDPDEPISTKFGTAGRLANLIAHDNYFFGNRLRGFVSLRGRIFYYDNVPVARFQFHHFVVSFLHAVQLSPSPDMYCTECFNLLQLQLGQCIHADVSADRPCQKQT